jgi:cobalamin biosynthesis protein CbiG
MPDIPGSIEEIDVRISTVRENLRQLVEQAAAYSGNADDELVSQRIAEQEAQLDILTKRRAALASAALNKDDRNRK